jgi:dihydrofolate reductase
MRKLINSTYISLDGVIENPQDWPSLGSSDERGYELQLELLQSSDVLVMGRRTYEGFAPVWSTQSGDPFSDHINSMDKYVASSTLESPEWTNTTVIDGDPVETIRGLKEQPGANIVQYGFGRLSFALMEHGLLDELRLWVHPFFVGKGGPSDLLYRDTTTTMFDLLEATALESGMVVLSYRYAGATAES